MLASAATQGYQAGRASGGSGLASALTELAGRLKQQRETQDATAYKQKILGMEEASKGRLLEKKSALKSEEENKSILGLIAGLQPAENILTPEQISTVAPRTIGRAGGGEVLAPTGARFEEGQIISPEGRTIGEFAPGFEPKPFAPAIGAGLRKRLDVTREEAGRKLLGLPKATKQTGRITPTGAMNILSDRIKSNQFKIEFGNDAFEQLKEIAASGLNHAALSKKKNETITIMDTNF